MPLPTKVKKYTVLRSVHVNKDSREHLKWEYIEDLLK